MKLPGIHVYAPRHRLNQAAGGPLGFVNPLLYKIARDEAGVYFDVVPQPLQAGSRQAAAIR